MNLFTKQRLADIENKLIATNVQMGAGGAKRDKLGGWHEQIHTTMCAC